MTRLRQGALTEVLEAFGQSLRDFRLATGITQEQVAETLEVSSQAIRNWESGRHEPTYGHLELLEELYGVKIKCLLHVMPRSGSFELVDTRGTVSVMGQRVLAGSLQHSEPSNIPVPEFLLKEYPNAIAFVISGDSLSSSDINDGDILFVNPDDPYESSNIHVVKTNKGIFARVVESLGDHLRLKGLSEGEEEFTPDTVENLGKVIWQLRRL